MFYKNISKIRSELPRFSFLKAFFFQDFPIKKLFVSLLLLPIVFPLSGIAIDPTTSGRILDNFKQSEEEILFDSLPLSDSDSAMLLEHEYTL